MQNFLYGYILINHKRKVSFSFILRKLFDIFHALLARVIFDWINFFFSELFFEVLLFSQRSYFFSGYRFDEDESDTLTENDYLFLCQEIGHRWKRFARQVDINENLIENIINTDCNDNDRCYKIFGKLGARDGSVKCNLVKMALQDLEYQNIIGKFNSFKVGPENRV